MLSIQWIQDVNYYLDQATADYYFRPGEPPGRWWGQGAKSLGLMGTVTAKQLKALCRGYSPDGKPLVQNAGSSKHQQAWDLTFSAPKSVSILWCQARTDIRIKIRRFHFKAIKAAMSYLTEVAILTRRGKAGLIREPAHPIVAVFEHGSNRELEPQLHSHCVLVNVAARSDGSFGTILSKPFYEHKLTAGAIYQAELAHLLRQELGIEIEKQETAFGVVGIPQQLIDHYSTRSKQIRGQLGKWGKSSAKAAATAALQTRKAKPTPPSRAELYRRWQETNSNFGFTAQSAQRLIGKVRPRKRPIDLTKAIVLGVRELLETESFFSEQRLIRHVAIQVMGEGISAKQIIKRVRQYLAENSEIVRLGSYRGEPQFTTQEMLTLEKELFSLIKEANEANSHVVPKSIVDKLLEERLPLGAGLTSDELVRNREQRAAVQMLTTSPGAIKVLEGMAGTGKTYTLSIVKDAFEKAGYKVIGAALSGVAARNLQHGAGIQSDTIAKRLDQLDRKSHFVRHHKRQLKRLFNGLPTYAFDGVPLKLDRKTVVIVDEAGMNGTKQMLELAQHVKNAGALLLPVGDRLQLQPIEAGNPFVPIADNSPSAKLGHVVRQAIEPDDPNPTWHRETGKLIAHGRAAEAIKLFAERGRFLAFDDADQTALALVRDWSVGGIRNPEDNIILAGTRTAVAELNTKCQSARLSADALSADCVEIANRVIYVGDTVMFTKKYRVFGVENGDRGIVLGFNRMTKTMAVRLIATGKTVFIPYRRFEHLDLGYAMTTHKAQGATVPNTYVLLGGPMQDLHLSYVQATRASQSTRLYVDRHNAGPDLRHLLNQMSKLRSKQLAHDVISENESPSQCAVAIPVATHKEATQKHPPVVQEGKSIPSAPSKIATRNTQPTRPVRNVLDLSHLRIKGTTDANVLNAAVARYGRLPGGIVVEGEATCDIPITSVAFQPVNPSELVVNEAFRFDTGLSAEEVALLWHSVLNTGQAEQNFGVLTQREALGIENDTLVAVNMMVADNWLGGLIYGYDSTFELGKSDVPSYSNPFLKEAQTSIVASNFSKHCFNQLYGLSPQLFFKVTSAHFAESPGGELRVLSSDVTIPIGVIHGDRKIVTQLPGEPARDSLIAERFPSVFRAHQDFVAKLPAYAASEDAIARTIAYGELVQLLRLAKSSKANFSGSQFMDNVLQHRQKLPLPRFDYTLRSKQFAEVARRASKELSQYQSEHSTDGLMAAIVGLDYACLAGESDCFITCKKHAIEHLRLSNADRASDVRSPEAQELKRLAPEIAQLLQTRSHDCILSNCVRVAFQESLPADEQNTYLQDALRLCTPATLVGLNSATRCCWIEARTHFEPDLNVLAEFAKIRNDDPSSMQPFITMNRIVSRRLRLGDHTQGSITWREKLLGINELSYPVRIAWQKAHRGLNNREMAVLLEELQRLRVLPANYLTYLLQPKPESPIFELYASIVEKLLPLNVDSFSTHLLRRDNPFVFSHALLDLESQDRIEDLFREVRAMVEGKEVKAGAPYQRSRQFLSKFLPIQKLDHPAIWWQKYLETNAPASTIGASKTTLLLAYELKIRNKTVEQLYEKMQKFSTKNPQAVLFLWDLESGVPSVL